MKIKNREFRFSFPKDSFSRRAVQYTNNLLQAFKSVGLTEDDVDISQERLVIKKSPASVSWWVDDVHCNFSYSKESRFVNNLYVVSVVVSHFIHLLIQEEISLEEFIETFKEKVDVGEQRLAAREFFDLEGDVDMVQVNKSYKRLAKMLHPDMPTGDGAKFKELNHHHKVLKREFS